MIATDIFSYECTAGSARLRLKEHESGLPCISIFELTPTAPENAAALINEIECIYKDAEITTVKLKVEQSDELKTLKNIGFVVDGTAYEFTRQNLEQMSRGQKLPANYTHRTISNRADLEIVTAIELEIHKLDTTTRVNFDSPKSMTSMHEFYDRQFAQGNITGLYHDEKLVGFLSSSRSRSNPENIDINTFGISTSYQGKKLSLPFLAILMQDPRFDDVHAFVGVTTTSKILAFAKSRGMKPSSFYTSRARTLRP